MTIKKRPTVVDPVTAGTEVAGTLEVSSFNGRQPDVVRLDPLIYSNPPVKQPVMVQTGIDIITRQPIFKPAPPEVEDQWKTPDRRPYVVLQYITGSYNTRPLVLNVGKIVYLNDKEYEIFKPYVKEAPCD
jgi:hypothetical protein